MNGEHYMTILVGIFPSVEAANRASQALEELGVPPGQISRLPSAHVDSSDIVSSPAFESFSEDQIRTLGRDLDAGRAILTIRAGEEADALIEILIEHGAVRVQRTDPTSRRQSSQTLPLYEEQLRVNREMREIGEVVIRKVVEDVPTRAEVEALHEELDVETVSVDEVVEQRRPPWREGDVLVVPVYEEQLTVVRQLVMREQLRISLHQVAEKHSIEETLRREHAVIEDPDQTGRVRLRRRRVEPVDDSDRPSASEHGV